MRTTTAGELTTLGLTTRTVTPRIKVANGSGTMIDVTPWFEHAKIDHDVDQPVGGATISFTRAHGLTQSLAPLRTDSTLNVKDDLSYAPLLDLNRSTTIEVATTPIGTVPIAADYKLLFKGTIDVVEFEQSPVVVTCRDLGAPLVDRWIETEATYGSGGGTAIQTVMQNILDAVFGGGVYTLYVPVSPGANVTTYRQQKMTVMDALQDLAQQIGWDVRFKWDDGTSAFRLTLSEPPRTKTVPDYTFGPSAYHDITRLSLDITNVRNVVTGSFRDAGNMGNRNTVTVSDGPSITKYGRRFFYIQEADVSPIDTSAEMTTMVTAALSDLKEPKAEQEVDMPFFWPADISDLYRYSPNSVHYNSNQDIAVVELTHELTAGENPIHRTRALVRGTPIGQYATWLGRGSTMGGGGASGSVATAPYPFITPLGTEADDLTWDLRFNAINGSGGGGTNLTYTIKLKKSFGAETTLNSGNASAFPKDLTVTRDPKQNAVLTFRVTDAATGLFAEATWSIPAANPFVNATGNLLGGSLVDASVTKTKTETRFSCKAINVSPVSISDSTTTDFPFDDDLWDVGAIHDEVTNNDRFVVPTGGDTGVWFIQANIRFAAHATGRRKCRLWHMPVGGGVGVIIDTVIVAGFSDGGEGPAINLHAIAQPPSVGDYFRVDVWQNSTGALDVLGTSWFSVTHVW